MNAVVGSVPNMEALSKTELSLSIPICVSDVKEGESLELSDIQTSIENKFCKPSLMRSHWLFC